MIAKIPFHKNPIPRYLFFSTLFFLASFLTAQGGTADSGAVPFVQRISWAEDQYALRYEVLIEKEVNGEYRREKQEYTDRSSIEVSLLPGQYRCRVTPYDLLNRPGEGSEWLRFEVRPAEEIIAIAIAEPVVQEKDPEPVSVLKEPEPLFEPEQIAEKAPKEKKPPREKVKKVRDKAVDIYLGAQWLPQLPVYGGGNDFLGTGPALAGAGIRFGMAYSKLGFMSPGFELAASWHKVDALHSVSGGLNLLVQKWFANEKMALRVRAGAGFTWLPQSPYTTISMTEGIHINTGLSFLWLPWKLFYLEAGVDFAHYFTSDQSGSFLPFIGAGLKL